MKKLTLPIFILAALVGGCKNPFEAKDKGIEELNKIETRWEDTVTLASSTSRIALASPVSQLQEIKRDLSAIELGSCLSPARDALDNYMGFQISNFLNFMSDSEFSNFEHNQKIVEYFDLKKKCTDVINSNSKLALEAELLSQQNKVGVKSPSEPVENNHNTWMDLVQAEVDAASEAAAAEEAAEIQAAAEEAAAEARAAVAAAAEARAAAAAAIAAENAEARAAANEAIVAAAEAQAAAMEAVAAAEAQ